MGGRCVPSREWITACGRENEYDRIIDEIFLIFFCYLLLPFLTFSYMTLVGSRVGVLDFGV